MAFFVIFEDFIICVHFCTHKDYIVPFFRGNFELLRGFYIMCAKMHNTILFVYFIVKMRPLCRYYVFNNIICYYRYGS